MITSYSRTVSSDLTSWHGLKVTNKLAIITACSEDISRFANLGAVYPSWSKYWRLLSGIWPRWSLWWACQVCCILGSNRGTFTKKIVSLYDAEVIAVRQYLEITGECRRRQLLSYFDTTFSSDSEVLVEDPLCCDVCASSTVKAIAKCIHIKVIV